MGGVEIDTPSLGLDAGTLSASLNKVNVSGGPPLVLRAVVVKVLGSITGTLTMPIGLKMIGKGSDVKIICILLPGMFDRVAVSLTTGVGLLAS